MFLGNETLVNLARRVGITEKLEAVPSLPLGTNEINIIQMAAGYASFANLGYKVDGHLIEKVIDGNNNVIYERNNQKDLVLNSSLVYILNNMLTSTYDPLYVDYNYPTGISLNGKLKHTYSLKSGTTKGDNWNIGYNSKVVCAVWIGHDDNTELTKNFHIMSVPTLVFVKDGQELKRLSGVHSKDDILTEYYSLRDSEL